MKREQAEPGYEAMSIPVSDNHELIKNLGEFVKYCDQQSGIMIETGEQGPVGKRIGDALNGFLLEQTDGMTPVSHDEVHRLIIGHAMLVGTLEEIINRAQREGN